MNRFPGTLISLFLVGVSLVAHSQEFSPLYKKYKDKYPNAHFIRLLDEIKIDVSLNDDDLEISQKIREDNLYMSPGATFGSKKAIHYSSFFEVDDVKAASLIYEGGKYKEVPVTDFVQKDDMNTSFYDDGKTINFIYPKLQEGAKTSLSYSQKIKNPRFLNALFFGLNAPIAKSKFILSVDNDITLELKEFNLKGLDIKFSKVQKKGKTIYTWETEEVAAYDMDSGAPSFRTIVPHIIPVLTSYKTKKETKQLSASVSDLYNWYYSLVKDVNTASSSPELTALVNKLIKDKKTDLEKVKAIYYWTQENVKYIAFEYALGGFIPREANDVFRKKYGDCKDNSSILSEMLKIAKLKGNLTWIGTRSIPYTYSEVPTPVVDNHMILSYIEGENVYYLDATGRYTPIDMPSSFIQGKEALIGIDENEFVVKKVPVVAAEKNRVKDIVYINIDDKKIIGNGKFEISGYPKSDLFHALEKMTKQTDLKEFYTYQLRKGSNRFLIDDFEEHNKFEYEKDFTVDYSFNIENYVQAYENEVYVNLNLNRGLSRLKEDNKRKSAKQYNYQSFNETTTFLEIPANLMLDYVPESFEISNDFFDCKITYTVKENKVIYKLAVYQKFIELTLEEQQELNKMIKKIEKNYKEVVILKKK